MLDTFQSPHEDSFFSDMNGKEVIHSGSTSGFNPLTRIRSSLTLRSTTL